MLHEAADLLDNRPFVDRGHRQVRRAPLAEHTQPAELVALDADVPLGVGPAGGADLRRRHGRLPGPQVLVDLVLNRQPVAVPARNIRGVEPHHGARLHDNVLEDLVERLAQVDVAVRVRGPVVQDVARPAGPGAAQRGVDVHAVPLLENLRLAARQVRLHREVGARQVESVLEVGRFHGSRDRWIALAASGLAGARKHEI